MGKGAIALPGKGPRWGRGPGPGPRLESRGGRRGLEGLVVGMIAGRADRAGRKTLAAAVGGMIMVAGYFIFEAWLYPSLGRSIPFFAVTNFGAAVIEVVPNIAQFRCCNGIGRPLMKSALQSTPPNFVLA